MLRMLGLIAAIFMFALSSWSQTRMISHVTRAGGGFSSTVIIENDAVTAQDVTLTPFDASGNALSPVNLSLSAREVISRDAATLFEGEVSHFEIQADDSVKVGLSYDFASGNGSPAQVAASSDTASSWRLFPGKWDNIFDGVAVVNRGEAATDLWIAQKDFAGNVLDAVQISEGLAPNGKALFVIGSPNDSVFQSRENTYYELSGDQHTAITALRGTLGDAAVGLLWANEARPLSQSSSKRDDRGVWFINDGDVNDVFEMFGYNVAVDRMFQLEAQKRSSRGTFSEVLGTTTINFDTRTRQRTYTQAELEAEFEALSEVNKTIFRAYADGINRRIGQINASVARTAGTAENSLMPADLVAIQYSEIQPFTAHDIMSIVASTQRSFSMRILGAEQVENGALLQQLQAQFGEEQGGLMFNDLRFTNDPEAFTMIDNPRPATKSSKNNHYPIARTDIPDLSEVARKIRREAEADIEVQRKYGAFRKMGSYAWAVSGSLTDTGNPMLYSGPQINFAAPTSVFECSIESDFMTVSGMALPGIPAVVVGRTPHHAWSMQVGHANTWDYYIVDDSEIETLTDTIEVFNGSPVDIAIERSKYGPVIDDLGDQRLAFKYAHIGYDFDLERGIIAMAQANSIDEFSEALSNLAISQHFMYVDVDNNLGYWMSGRNPVRPEGDYRVPQGLLANQDVLEWDAAVVEPLPHDRNPERGWYAGWNNKASDAIEDKYATAGFGPYQRAHLLGEIFTNRSTPWTFDEIKDIAIEIGASVPFVGGGNPWAFIGDAVNAAVLESPSEERNGLMAQFGNWDGKLIAGGPSQWIAGPNLSEEGLFLLAFIPVLTEKIFNDELGPSPADVLVDPLFRFQAFLHGVRDSGLTNNYNWFQNINDPDAPQTASEIIIAAIDDTLALLGPQPWGQSARTNLPYLHPLFGDITFLAEIQPFQPTPNMIRATYAHAVEYGPEGPVKIQSMMPLGQSGEILGSPLFPVFNPFSFSMHDDFTQFILRDFPFFGQD